MADTKYAGTEGFTELLFFSYFDLIELHVPYGSKAKYQAHSLWGRFTKIVEDEPAGIDAVASDRPDCQPVYTLSGVKLRSTDPRSLPKGIYIRSGKKIVVGK